MTSAAPPSLSTHCSARGCTSCCKHTRPCSILTNFGTASALAASPTAHLNAAAAPQSTFYTHLESPPFPIHIPNFLYRHGRVCCGFSTQPCRVSPACGSNRCHVLRTSTSPAKYEQTSHRRVVFSMTRHKDPIQHRRASVPLRKTGPYINTPPPKRCAGAGGGCVSKLLASRQRVWLAGWLLLPYAGVSTLSSSCVCGWRGRTTRTTKSDVVFCFTREKGVR